MTEPIDNTKPDVFRGAGKISAMAILAASVASMEQHRQKTREEFKAKENALEIRRLETEIHECSKYIMEAQTKGNTKREERFRKRYRVAKDALEGLGYGPKA